MTGYLAFCDKYSDEAACIEALAELKWPEGFCCDKCEGRKAYHLASRVRLFQCADCGHQHSITAGTIFHKTRTPLRKWFVAAYLISHDKRGVSALYASRELAIRYDTAWLMCHKIRHALSESSMDFLLDDCVEVAETFYGGRRQKGDRGRSITAGGTMIVCAVEQRSTSRTTNQGINRQGFVAGGARIAVLANATAAQLGGFIRANIKPGTTIFGGGCASLRDLNESNAYSIARASDVHGGVTVPIVHTLFSNVKAWLNGTHHGVSAKHLPRYLREWSYRFNRRGHIQQLADFLLRRTISRATITYAELVAGRMTEGAA